MLQAEKLVWRELVQSNIQDDHHNEQKSHATEDPPAAKTLASRTLPLCACPRPEGVDNEDT